MARHTSDFTGLQFNCQTLYSNTISRNQVRLCRSNHMSLGIFDVSKNFFLSIQKIDFIQRVEKQRGEVPGLAQRDSRLHVSHIRKHWSYAFFQVSDLRCFKILSQCCPCPTVSVFSQYLPTYSRHVSHKAISVIRAGYQLLNLSEKSCWSTLWISLH